MSSVHNDIEASESYFFDTRDEFNNDKVYVLIIYDIINNKKRNKLAKFLQGYGFRIQKSAFEAKITKKKYNDMIKNLPQYASNEDNIRVYKIVGKGQVTNFGGKCEIDQEEVLIF